MIVGAGLLSAAVVQLLARSAGGRGSFEDTVALLGIAIAGSTLGTLIPDLAIGSALNLGWVDPTAWMFGVTHPTATLAAVWAYLLVYVALFLASFPAVTRAVHGLGGWRALAVGWAGFFVYQGVLFVFVR